MTTESDVPARLKDVRKAARKTQAEFVPILEAAAAELFGPGVRRYPQATLSRLETGGQVATLEDIAVFARVDPQRRGKLWVGWGETADADAVPQPTSEKPIATIDIPDSVAIALSEGRKAGRAGTGTPPEVEPDVHPTRQAKVAGSRHAPKRPRGPR